MLPVVVFAFLIFSVVLSAAQKLDDLDDVIIIDPFDGQYLRFDNSSKNWTNVNVSPTNPFNQDLNTSDDVDFSGLEIQNIMDIPVSGRNLSLYPDSTTQNLMITSGTATVKTGAFLITIPVWTGKAYIKGFGFTFDKVVGLQSGIYVFPSGNNPAAVSLYGANTYSGQNPYFQLTRLGSSNSAEIKSQFGYIDIVNLEEGTGVNVTRSLQVHEDFNATGEIRTDTVFTCNDTAGATGSFTWQDRASNTWVVYVEGGLITSVTKNGNEQLS